MATPTSFCEDIHAPNAGSGLRMPKQVRDKCVCLPAGPTTGEWVPVSVSIATKKRGILAPPSGRSSHARWHRQGGVMETGVLPWAKKCKRMQPWLDTLVGSQPGIKAQVVRTHPPERGRNINIRRGAARFGISPSFPSAPSVDTYLHTTTTKANLVRTQSPYLTNLL